MKEQFIYGGIVGGTKVIIEQNKLQPDLKHEILQKDDEIQRLTNELLITKQQLKKEQEFYKVLNKEYQELKKQIR